MAGLILSLTKAKVEPVTATQLGENHKVTGLEFSVWEHQPASQEGDRTRLRFCGCGLEFPSETRYDRLMRIMLHLAYPGDRLT